MDPLKRDHWMPHYDPAPGYDGCRPRFPRPAEARGQRSASLASLSVERPASAPRAESQPPLADLLLERAIAAAQPPFPKPSWTLAEFRAPVHAIPGYVGHKPRFWDPTR